MLWGPAKRKHSPFPVRLEWGSRTVLIEPQVTCEPQETLGVDMGKGNFEGPAVTLDENQA